MKPKVRLIRAKKNHGPLEKEARSQHNPRKTKPGAALERKPKARINPYNTKPGATLKKGKKDQPEP